MGGIGEQSLLAADAERATRLSTEIGWNQTAADWRLMLSWGRGYKVQQADGTIVATALSLPYGRFGYVSMVLVAPAFRRRGWAGHLLRRCLDDLAALKQTPVLDATPAGRPVYAALGFAEAWGLTRLQGRGGGGGAETGSGVEVRQLTPLDMAYVDRLDGRAFGASRPTVVVELARRLPAAALLATRHGRAAGFLLGRDGRTARQLGPLVAADDEIARALLSRACAVLDGPLIVDLADARPDLRTWLEGRGFSAQRPFARMVRGDATVLGDAALLAASAGPELG